jgi:hypothetical protein
VSGLRDVNDALEADFDKAAAAAEQAMTPKL